MSPTSVVLAAMSVYVVAASPSSELRDAAASPRPAAPGDVGLIPRAVLNASEAQDVPLPSSFHPATGILLRNRRSLPEGGSSTVSQEDLEGDVANMFSDAVTQHLSGCHKVRGGKGGKVRRNAGVGTGGEEKG